MTLWAKLLQYLPATRRDLDAAKQEILSAIGAGTDVAKLVEKLKMSAEALKKALANNQPG